VTYNEYLKQDYDALVEAANKISGNSPLALDLLHYCIVDFSYKKNMQEILDSGGTRFYIIRMMMTQQRSVTGPFYRNYVKRSLPILGDAKEEKEEDLDVSRIKLLLDQLPWYDRELFKLFTEGQHNYKTLSELTLIPRTSISLTIRRVREYIKNNI